MTLSSLNASWTVGRAKALAGTLGFPSKMPGTAYGIPAAACNVGAKLRQVAGSTCEKCYAFNGNYGFRDVKKSQAARLLSIDNAEWVPAMVWLLNHAHGLTRVRRRGKIGRGRVHRKIKRGGRYWHRWHDAGDIQSLAHLCKIVVICQLTPKIRHWLPTREAGIVAQFLRNGGVFPANLCVRVSATMVDGAPSHAFANTSTVHNASAPIGHECPAPKQGGVCGRCRACWDRSVQNTSYHLH
jgi:hypothetical protein